MNTNITQNEIVVKPPFCENCGIFIMARREYKKRRLLCWSCWLKRDRLMRARRSGAAKLKIKLIKKHGKVCQRCRISGPVMLHHIVPISKGGETKENNCILLCQACHKEKHNGRSVGRQQ